MEFDQQDTEEILPKIGCSTPINALTLTPFYPSKADDANGCFVAEPLAALTQMGVQNSVLAVEPFYRAKRSPNESAAKAEFVRYFSWPGGAGLASAGAFLFAQVLGRVRAWHRERPIDVIHAHGPLPCGHAAMLLARELTIPHVVSVHGLDAYSTRQVRGRAGEWCRRVSAQVFRSARNVVCISEHVREQVLTGTRASTTVVYNGADPEVFSPGPETSKSPTSIVSIGNLIPTKGHDVLLRAFAAAGAAQPAMRLDIVGEGPEKARLQSLARQLQVADRIRWLGRVSRGEVARLLRECVLFVLPSSYEGLGCVYLEAMSSGKVAIGCRGQGIEEVIRHGSNGWLVDPGNAEQLATGLSTLLGNPGLREAMGAQARHTILSGFTLQHQAERLLRIYRESQS
jgi:teichuronic acid biosynthesis glycosyltransferase TuaC